MRRVVPLNLHFVPKLYPAARINGRWRRLLLRLSVWIFERGGVARSGLRYWAARDGFTVWRQNSIKKILRANSLLSFRYAPKKFVEFRRSRLRNVVVISLRFLPITNRSRFFRLADDWNARVLWNALACFCSFGSAIVQSAAPRIALSPSKFYFAAGDNDSIFRVPLRRVRRFLSPDDCKNKGQSYHVFSDGNSFLPIPDVLSEKTTIVL